MAASLGASLKLSNCWVLRNERRSHRQQKKGPVLATPGPLDHTVNEFDYPMPAGPRKALETIKVQFALCGHAVHDGGNHDFIVVHRDWGQSRHCPDYSALIRFGRQLGVLA